MCSFVNDLKYIFEVLFLYLNVFIHMYMCIYVYNI